MGDSIDDYTGYPLPTIPDSDSLSPLEQLRRQKIADEAAAAQRDAPLFASNAAFFQNNLANAGMLPQQGPMLPPTVDAAPTDNTAPPQQNMQQLMAAHDASGAPSAKNYQTLLANTGKPPVPAAAVVATKTMPTRSTSVAAQAPSGVQQEAQSKSALDDLMTQLAAHRTIDPEEQRRQMWLNFFSGMGKSNSPTLLGAISGGAEQIAPTIQAQNDAKRAADEKGLEERIKLAEYQQDYGLKSRQTGAQELTAQAHMALANARADGTGGGGVTQWKYDTYLALHPGDAQGALQYAAGHKQMDDISINKAAMGYAKTDALGLNADGKMTPDQLHQAYVARIKGVGAGGVGGAGGNSRGMMDASGNFIPAGN